MTGSPLTISSLAIFVPILFVCVIHRGGDLTQVGEAVVFQPQTTETGLKGEYATQQGPIGSSSGIFQLKPREEMSHPF